MRCVVIGLMIYYFLFQASALQAEASLPDKETCRSYVVMFCTRCHKAERICKVLGTKSEQQWKETIKKMGDYDDMDEHTRQTIYSCLSPLSAGDPLVCTK